MPRWRSPATALVAKPMAKTELRISEIGWIAPSAIAPERLKMSPPPNCISCLGMSPESMMDLNVWPNVP